MKKHKEQQNTLITLHNLSCTRGQAFVILKKLNNNSYKKLAKYDTKKILFTQQGDIKQVKYINKNQITDAGLTQLSNLHSLLKTLTEELPEKYKKARGKSRKHGAKVRIPLREYIIERDIKKILSKLDKTTQNSVVESIYDSIPCCNEWYILFKEKSPSLSDSNLETCISSNRKLEPYTR